MVGPEAEATGLVRHASRLLVAGAALRVPLVAVILRRGYGLGAQAMTGGSLHEPLLTVAWPSAHLGPMGLEGAVRLALRKELEAIADEAEREQRVRDLTAAAEDNAKALNAAALFELDDVIDPAETRGRDRRHPRPPRRRPTPVPSGAASSTPGEAPGRFVHRETIRPVGGGSSCACKGGVGDSAGGRVARTAAGGIWRDRAFAAPGRGGDRGAGAQAG